MKKIFSDLMQRHNEIQLKINQQKSQLDDLKAKTSLKLKNNWRILNELTEENLRTTDKLQNEVSKIEAYSCSEEGKLKLVIALTCEIHAKLVLLTVIFV